MKRNYTRKRKRLRTNLQEYTYRKRVKGRKKGVSEEKKRMI